jgi:hypothetical protein
MFYLRRNKNILSSMPKKAVVVRIGFGPNFPVPKGKPSVPKGKKHIPVDMRRMGLKTAPTGKDGSLLKTNQKGSHMAPVSPLVAGCHLHVRQSKHVQW